MFYYTTVEYNYTTLTIITFFTVGKKTTEPKHNKIRSGCLQNCALKHWIMHPCKKILRLKFAVLRAFVVSKNRKYNEL